MISGTRRQLLAVSGMFVLNHTHPESGAFLIVILVPEVISCTKRQLALVTEINLILLEASKC